MGSPTVVEVPREELRRALGHPGDVAQQARVAPAYQNGAIIGVKLFSIRPASIFLRLGIHNGDVVRRINGRDTHTPEELFAAISLFADSNRVELDVDRQDGASSQVHLTIDIR